MAKRYRTDESLGKQKEEIKVTCIQCGTVEYVNARRLKQNPKSYICEDCKNGYEEE